MARSKKTVWDGVRQVGETFSAVAQETFQTSCTTQGSVRQSVSIRVTSHAILPSQELRTQLGMEGKKLSGSPSIARYLRTRSPHG